MVAIISSTVASISIAKAHSAIKSVALGPIICAPNISMYSFPTINLIIPSPPIMSALPLPDNGNFPTT